jgi:ribonuclease inhibitor
MRIEIDGATILTESDLHDALADALNFGPYYGRNLDALWDRLSTDIERPVELTWRDSVTSRRAMGETVFASVSELLIKVMRQDESLNLQDRFTVHFE